MKIVAVHDDVISMQSPIRNAVVDFSHMTTSIVGVMTDVIRNSKPVIGYGFTSIGRYSQSGILRSRMIPRLLSSAPASILNEAGDNFDPFKVWNVIMANEKPGGHGERSAAVGALDMAIWDITAKIQGVPLYQMLADRYKDGQVNHDVFVYAAGGYYAHGRKLQDLKEEIKQYLDLGYTAVKMKIGGVSLHQDLRRIEAVLEVVGHGKHLAVDANARFNIQEAIRYARALEQFDLNWYEEPGDPLDFLLHSVIAQVTDIPLATGENIFSLIDATNLIRYGGLRPHKDFIQIDPALSYGLVEYIRILNMLREHGWSWQQCIPHGGHQLTLHIAAGLGLGGNESYPHVFQPVGGFGDRAKVMNGYVRPPDSPGIGLETNSGLMRYLQPLFPQNVY